MEFEKQLTNILYEPGGDPMVALHAALARNAYLTEELERLR